MGYFRLLRTRGGWRKVVPSPMPSRIVGDKAIKYPVDSGCLVIASGGGGIPVVVDEQLGYKGIEAVIDKDLAGELPASIVDADVPMILTDIITLLEQAVDALSGSAGTRLTGEV